MFRVVILFAIPAFVFCGPARALTQETEDADSTTGTELPPGVVAVVNGYPVPLEQYRVFLLREIGRQRLNDLIDRIIVEDAARRQGVEISFERIDQEIQKALASDLEYFDGDLESYRAHLKRLGRTLEEQKELLRSRTMHRLVVDTLIVKNRSVSTADRRRRFEGLYGADGMRIVIRRLLIQTPGSPTVPPPERLELGKKVLEEINDTGDFAAAAKKYSDDAASREQGGLITDLRRRDLHPAVEKAVARLTETGEVSGMLFTPTGIEIVQLVRREKIRLEDVAEEITRDLEKRPPTPKERLELLKKLRRQARIQLAD